METLETTPIPDAGLPASDVVGNPDFLPYRLDGRTGHLVFMEWPPPVLRRAAFLDRRAEHLARRRAMLPLAAVEGALQGRPADPAPGLIFHTSFCGTTLLTRCLDMPRRCRVLREPLVLEDLDHARAREGATPQWRRRLAVVLALLSRRTGDGERVVIKPSNAANALLPEITGLDGGHCRVLLMHGGVQRLLTSLIRRGEAGRMHARRLFALVARDDPALTRVPVREIALMTDLQLAGLAWLAQLSLFRRMLGGSGERRCRSLSLDRFHQRPTRALAEVASHLRVPLSGSDIAEIVNGPLFHTDAKQPGSSWSAASNAEVHRRLLDEHGEDLEALVGWLARFGEVGNLESDLPAALAA